MAAKSHIRVSTEFSEMIRGERLEMIYIKKLMNEILFFLLRSFNCLLLNISLDKKDKDQRLPTIIMASVSRLFQLSGTCNNYPWGKKGHQSLAAKLCKQTLGTDFTINDDEHYSEMWFGDYPDFPARDLETGQTLADLLKSNEENLLGSYSMEKFGNNLPFLPKVGWICVLARILV
jgi:hypothetical protein